MRKGMRKGKVTEITIEEDPIEEELKPLEQYYTDELCAYTDYEIRIVHLNDDDATVVETTFTNEPSFVPRWLRYVDRDHRKRRAPLLLSVASYTAVGRPTCWPYDGPPRFKCPIRVVSLCVGGSHCLVYDVGNINSKWERGEMLKYNPLRRLLEDRSIAVVGIGMKRFAAQAREEWGVHVANPVDLRSVVVEAVGEGKIRSAKFGVEEMLGEVVLDGLKMKEKPKRIKEMDWGRQEITEEMLMYATRDAYLAFEVGKKCFEMIGRKI